MKTMGANITTIDYLRVLIIEIGSTIILMVVEAQEKKKYIYCASHKWREIIFPCVPGFATIS